jgi:hypothetical protein
MFMIQISRMMTMQFHNEFHLLTFDTHPFHTPESGVQSSQEVGIYYEYVFLRLPSELGPKSIVPHVRTKLNATTS